MSEHVVYKCENEKCGIVTENRYAKKGWVHIDGAVSAAAGFYSEGSYRTAFLRGPKLDFCSIACLAARLEDGMLKQAEALQGAVPQS